MANEFPLSLIIKAVDKATAPLRAINEKIRGFTAPVRKLNNSFKALSDEAGLPRLVKSFSGVGSAVGKVGREVMALGLKLSAMAAGAGYALYRILRGSVDAGDKLSEMAQRVGLSVDAYAQLQFAAEQADVTQEGFNSAMDRFNKNLGEAKAGTGTFLAFLYKVSPALAMQVRGAKDTEAALTLMTRAFEKLDDPSKIAALSGAAFGRGGLQMGQALHQGEKAIGGYRKRLVELAGSQEQFAKDSSDADNALRETEVAFLGLRNAAAGALFPALTELAQALADVLAGNRGALRDWARDTGKAISDWVKGGGIPRLVDSMKRWAETISGIVDRLGGLKGVAVVVGAVLAGPLVAAVATAIGAIGSLSAALLATPAGWVVLAIAGIAAAALLIYKHWQPIKKFFGDLWDSIVGIFKSAWEKVKPIVDTVTGAAKAIVEKFRMVSPLEYELDPSGVERGPGPALGADRARPGAAPAGKSEAHVVVDFNNVPRGARVTQDRSSTASLDLSMGYSMVGGG